LSIGINLARQVDAIDAEMKAFAKGASMSSQLWSRVIKVLEELPWMFVQLKDRRNSEAQLADRRQRILAKPLCCGDPAFSDEILNEIRKDPENALAILEALADEIIEKLCKHCPATNFGLERLLSLIRSASPKLKGRKPTASKVIARGALAQMIRRHLENGLDDCRGKQTRSQLIEGGVKIDAVSHARATSTGARWHIRYGNSKAKAMEEAGGSPLEQRNERSRACSAWKYLPANEVASFKASWRNKTQNDDGNDADKDEDDGIENDKILAHRLSPWTMRIGNRHWPGWVFIIYDILNLIWQRVILKVR